MGHSVGKAADNAVQKSTKTIKEERTTEQIIKDIRKNVAARLAITFDDTVVLLNEYDNILSGQRLIEAEQQAISDAASELLKAAITASEPTPQQILSDTENGI